MAFQVGVFFEWTNDTQRFLLEHFDTIHNSPSQIYHSALPFCPSSSWLHRYYGAELLNEVRIVRGLPVDWGTCSRTVALDNHIVAISSWINTIAVSMYPGHIIILNAVTGSQTGIFSEHDDLVNSVAFSSDGVFLISGSEDCTIKLWDVQTGGVVRTFLGHCEAVVDVCISADSSMIASGSDDRTVRLWNVQTGECCCVIEHQEIVTYVSFFAISSKHLVLASLDDKVWQLDINGHQIGLTWDASHFAFSPDGTQLALCKYSTVKVQNIKSGEDVAEFHVESGSIKYCCFSPGGGLIAACSENITYVWDLNCSEPSPIEIFLGHTGTIIEIEFFAPLSLISISIDRSVKFWQIGTSMTDPVGTNSKSTALHSAQVVSVTMQATYGITITTDSHGVVRIWDILTGHCKESFQIPKKIKDFHKLDVQLIDSTLIAVWCADDKITIWDATKEEFLSIAAVQFDIKGLNISGDGSKVFCMDKDSITVWSICTGQNMGKVQIGYSDLVRPLIVEDSRVWVQGFQLQWTGWDFEIPDSPIQLSGTPSQLHPNGVVLWDTVSAGIQGTTSGTVMFQLSTGLGVPVDVQWMDQYLVACFKSGKVLVFDCTSILLQ